MKAKDRAQRREAFIKTEALRFSKYGWFMARVLTMFGLLVIVFAVVSRNSAEAAITSLSIRNAVPIQPV